MNNWWEALLGLFRKAEPSVRVEVPITHSKEDLWRSRQSQIVGALKLEHCIARRTHVVVHHSLTKDGNVVDWAAIKRYHVNVNHWSDIGYHFGIERVDADYKVLAGRPLDTPGAHAKDGGFNVVSFGVCIVGNHDVETPANRAWWTAVFLIRRLCRQFNIPVSNVIGHWEAQAIAGLPAPLRKSCPGDKFSMDKFRKDLSAELA